MSCPREKDVLRLGTPAIDRAAVLSLEEHAADCAECRDALTLVIGSRALLRAAETEASPADLERIEGKLLLAMRSGRTDRPRLGAWMAEIIGARDDRGGLWSWAFASAALAAIALVAIWAWPVGQSELEIRAPAQASVFDGRVEVTGQEAPAGTSLPLGKVMTAEPRARIAFGRARIVADTRAHFALSPPQAESELRAESLALEDGGLAVAVDALEPTPFVVVTPAARIAIVGGTVHIRRSAAGTAISVEEGEAHVLTSGPGGAERVVSAGEQLVIRSGAVEKAPEAETRVEEKVEAEVRVPRVMRTLALSPPVKAAENAQPAEKAAPGPDALDDWTEEVPPSAGRAASKGAAAGPDGLGAKTAANAPIGANALEDANALDGAKALEGAKGAANAPEGASALARAKALEDAKGAGKAPEGANALEGANVRDIDDAASTQQRADRRALATDRGTSTDDEPGERRTGPDPRAPVAEARALLQKDAKSARLLAEKIIATRPAPEVEIEAMMIAADGARRSGDLSAALELFLRVAGDTHGEVFAEEALLRAARIQVQLHRPSDALDTLGRARPRYGKGPLLPEREALAARILRESDRLDEAARLLEGVPFDHSSLPLAEERIAVAKKLLASDPTRAARMVAPIAGSKLPVEIRVEAEDVLSRTIDRARKE